MLYALILSWMVSLQSLAVTPWADTFAETALAIDVSARARPVYNDDAKETAAIITATAWAESRFKPDAVDAGANGLCLMQVDRSNLRELGTTRKAILEDRGACLGAALTLMRTSFAICHGRPIGDLLGNYASGGGTCGGTDPRALWKSRYRIAIARRLLREHPYLDADKS